MSNSLLGASKDAAALGSRLQRDAFELPKRQRCSEAVRQKRDRKLCGNKSPAQSTLHATAAATAIEEVEIAQSSAREDIQIPDNIVNSVVRLQAPNSEAPEGHTDVFLLGMSHVSKESVEAVRSLIAAVRPEVVLVEVCKDRVGLMLNPDTPRDLQLWASRRVYTSGLPTAEGWPSESDVLSVCGTVPGRAFTTQEAEADCVRLLATGLFRSVRPSFKRPTGLDCPQFVRVSGDRLATVPPLGPVEFIVTPRILPAPLSFGVRIDSSLGRAGIQVPTEEVAKIENALLEECGRLNLEQKAAAKEEKPSEEKEEPSKTEEAAPKPEPPVAEEPAPAKKEKVPHIDALLRARQALVRVLSSSVPQEFDVSLNGVETGEIEAVIKARNPNQGFNSGLENSALGGEGYGIETFKPQRGPLQISSNMRIPNLAKVLRRESETTDDYITSVSPQSSNSHWRDWTVQEMIDAENLDEAEEDNSLGGKLAGLLSQTYAKFQNAAGETVGIKPGAAWRAALEAASENGGKQVLLGDMPAELAAESLAEGIWKGLSSRIVAAAVVAAAAITAAVTHILPSGSEPLAAGAVAVVVGAAAFPFLGPFVEVYLFSRKSAQQIEDTVRIKTSLQARGTEMLRLPGEDAIIGWPNAKETIIDQRDEFMARTLRAAATGSGAAPAFFLDTTGERHVWRYGMPQSAPAGCATQGCGDGEFEPVKGVRAVVGIVGSAHVGGIVREWERASDLDRLSELLGEQ